MRSQDLIEVNKSKEDQTVFSVGISSGEPQTKNLDYYAPSKPQPYQEKTTLFIYN